jgi:hypothetical protein
MLRAWWRSININFIVFGLPRAVLEPMIYLTRGQHTYHYATMRFSTIKEFLLSFNDLVLCLIYKLFKYIGIKTTPLPVRLYKLFKYLYNLSGSGFVLMPMYLNSLYNLAGSGFVLMPMYLNSLYNLAGSGFVLMPMYLNSLYNLAGNVFVLMPMYFNNLYITWLAMVLS